MHKTATNAAFDELAERDEDFVVFGFNRGADGLFEALTDGLDGAKLLLGEHWHEVWGDFAQIYGLAALDEHTIVERIT